MLGPLPEKLIKMKKFEPLVSICMITYNHENYIEEAIEGVFSQKVDFEYELVICNDNSPDNTDRIIKNIIENHPKGNKINYIRHKNNLGAIPNFHFSFKQARGKYIAICEGDDYWSDPLKLQKQTSFLERNLDYDASFHEVDMLFINKKIHFSTYRKHEVNQTVYFKDVVSNDWLIPTCSFVFRKKKMELPPFYDDFNYGDFPLFCCILLNSKAHYLNETMAVYRRNNTGSLTNTIRTFGHLKVSADYIKLLSWLNKYSNYEDQMEIESRINKEIENINSQINIYKNSRFIKIYSAVRKFIN